MSTRGPAVVSTYATTIDALKDAHTVMLREESVSELEHLAFAQRRLHELTSAAVRSARMEGASWASIGTALGISKQAAQQKYAKEALL